MRRGRLAGSVALLAGVAAGTGCTVNTGVKATPTFVAARQVPAAPVKPAAKRVEVAGGSSMTEDPTPAAMQGAAWVIANHEPRKVYRVPVQAGHVTAIKMPPGERFNAATFADMDMLLINPSYAESSVVVSLLPRDYGVRGNLQITTTGGLYLWDLVERRKPLDLVEVFHGDEDGETAAAGATRQGVWPEGEQTTLNLTTPDGRAMPAWKPAEAWADSYKLVIRFNGPLPTLPALFAGQQGEQMVSYSTSVDPATGDPLIITNRRVTEGQLRLDQEVVVISAVAPVEDTNPHGWRQAQALPAPGLQQPVNVYVMPGSSDGVVPATAFTDADREALFGKPGGT